MVNSTVAGEMYVPLEAELSAGVGVLKVPFNLIMSYMLFTTDLFMRYSNFSKQMD